MVNPYPIAYTSTLYGEDAKANSHRLSDNSYKEEEKNVPQGKGRV
jgi:hypothetical protein